MGRNILLFTKLLKVPMKQKLSFSYLNALLKLLGIVNLEFFHISHRS